MSKVAIFIDGVKDHECDDKGKWIYWNDKGFVTDDVAEARLEHCGSGSATCSICGQSSMNRSLWRDE